MTAVTGPLLRSRQSRHFVIVSSAFTAGPPPRFPRYLAASAGRFPNKRAGGRPPPTGGFHAKAAAAQCGQRLPCSRPPAWAARCNDVTLTQHGQGTVAAATPY